MSKLLKLQHNPTFELPVSVPVVGQPENEIVVFTVKNLTAKEMRDMGNEEGLYRVRSFCQEVVIGWDIDAEFNQDNLLILFDNYPHLDMVLFDAYQDEFHKAAPKN